MDLGDGFGAWKGAKELGYLKSLYKRELRSYPQVSKHIVGMIQS